MFCDDFRQGGQIGIPVDSQASEVFDAVLKEGNVRELMTMCMNFYKDPNGVGVCRQIFKDMVNMKLRRTTPRTAGRTTSRLRSMRTSVTVEAKGLNARHLTTRIAEIEKLLGFGIEETECPPFQETCRPAYDDAETGFPSLCSLWNPIVFLHGSHILTNPHVKWEGRLVDVVKARTQLTQPRKDCGIREEDVFPPLTSRERDFRFDGIVHVMWSPGMCWFQSIHRSLAEAVRRKYNKLSVANTSGHTLLHLEYARMLYHQEQDSEGGTARAEDRRRQRYERLMLLACIMWMVPYDHSIHEIMTAGKIMDVFPEYDYRRPSTQNLQTLLESVDLRHRTSPSPTDMSSFDRQKGSTQVLTRMSILP